MNFLAHAYLSFNNCEILTGNMIADSVRGAFEQKYPEGIVKGIKLHRSIDAYTDTHVLVKETRNYFSPVIKHYALVISDVIYDHFLGQNWDKYSTEPLPVFAQRSYKDLKKNSIYFPEKFARIFPYMKEHDWFTMYAEKKGIHQTIERLSYRSPAFVWAKETIDLLEKNYTAINRLFIEFFPQLVEHSKEFLKE